MNCDIHLDIGLVYPVLSNSDDDGQAIMRAITMCTYKTVSLEAVKFTITLIILLKTLILMARSARSRTLYTVSVPGRRFNLINCIETNPNTPLMASV